jgi:hypothetical protein
MSVADYVDKGLREIGVSISKPALAAMCFIFGFMVILLPSFLVWPAGLFLVCQGALLLADYFEGQRRMATTTATAGVYCRSCGAWNTEEAAYCSECGKELVQTALIATTEPQEVTQRTHKRSRRRVN